MVTEDRPHGPRKPIEMVLTDTFYPGSNLMHGGWDPAGDGGPDCPYCGREITSGPVCTHDECPGEVLTCEAIIFRGSRNPDSTAYGPDETCDKDVVPGSTVCDEHSYIIDEPTFNGGSPSRPAHLEPWQEPYMRVRSDGRLEVADEEVAGELYGCLRADVVDCVLQRDHGGACTEVRERWVGPSPDYEHPHKFVGES